MVSLTSHMRIHLCDFVALQLYCVVVDGLFLLNIPSHLRKSCSAVFPYIIHKHELWNMHCWPLLPTPFTDVFLIDLTADVTTVNPLSVQNQNQLDLLSIFIHATKHVGKMRLISHLYYAGHFDGSICIHFVSVLTYSHFTSNWSATCCLQHIFITTPSSLLLQCMPINKLLELLYWTVLG